jgi:hypothetical protein
VVSDSANQYLFTSALILLLSLSFTFRFADRIMSVIASLSFLALVFFCWSKLGTIGETTMPFVIMFFSYLIISGTTRAAKNLAYLNYQECLSFVQLTSLLTLYAAGNYFVIQKLSYQLHHLPQENNAPLPFGWFFWAWTMLLPLLYIGLGIKNKSLLLLRLGLLLVVISAYTFRNYYHLFPTEYVLVISGTVLLLMAVWVIRYLKKLKHGFTYAQRNSRHWANNVHLESLIFAGATHTYAFCASSKHGPLWRR